MTLAGIDIRLFAKKPTPEELGEYIAKMTASDQGDFIGWWSNFLKTSSGNCSRKIAEITSAAILSDSASADDSARYLLEKFATCLLEEKEDG